MPDLQELIKKLKEVNNEKEKISLIDNWFEQYKNTLDIPDILIFIEKILPLVRLWPTKRNILTALLQDISKQVTSHELLLTVFPPLVVGMEAETQHIRKVQTLAIWVGNPANSEEADQLIMTMLQPWQSTTTPVNEDIDNLSKLCVENEDKLKIILSWLENKKNKIDFNILQNILENVGSFEFIQAIDKLSTILDAKDLNELIQKRFLNTEKKWSDKPENKLSIWKLADVIPLIKNDQFHADLKLNIIIEWIRANDNLQILSAFNKLTDKELVSINEYIDDYVKKANTQDIAEFNRYKSFGAATIYGMLIMAWIRTMIDSPDTHKELSTEQTLLLKNYSEFKKRFLVVDNLVGNREQHGRDLDKMLSDHITLIGILTDIFGPDIFVILGKYLVTSALALERLLNNLNINPTNQMARAPLRDFFEKNRTDIIGKNKHDVFLSLSQLLSAGLDMIKNDPNEPSLRQKMFDILEKYNDVQQCYDEIAKYVIQYFLKAMNTECDSDVVLKRISPTLFGQFIKARSAMQGHFYQSIFEQFMIADMTGKPIRGNTKSNELRQLFDHNQKIHRELTYAGIDTDKAFNYPNKTSFECGGKIDNIDVNNLIRSLWTDLGQLYSYADEHNLNDLKKLLDNFQQTMQQGFKRTDNTLTSAIEKNIFNKIRNASLTGEKSRLEILIGAIKRLNLPEDRLARLLSNIEKVEKILNPLLLKHSPQSLMEVMWNNIEQLYKKADLLKTTPPNKALEIFLERLKKLSDTFLASIESDLLKTLKDTNNLSKVSKHITPAFFNKIYEDLSKKLQSNPSLVKDFIREMKEMDLDNKEVANLLKSLEGNAEKLNTLVSEASAQKYTYTTEKKVTQKKRFTIQVWDKSSPETFNLGAEVGCCLAPDGNCFPAMVERRMDDAMFMHVVTDVETNKPISLAWLFFAKDSNNDIYVIANFFEIAASYAFNTDMRDTIVSELQEYIATYAKEIGAKGFLMRPLTYGNIPDFKNCNQYATQLQKVGGFLSLNGQTSPYYLESLNKSSFHVFKSQKPEYTFGY